MKVIAFLAATAVMMAFNISSASSQGACGKEYQVCMDSCAGRSAKSLQDSCFQSCEGKNNICAERVYGKRPFNGAPSSAAAQKAQAKDALAKEKPQDAPVEPAAAPQEQAAAPAAEPAPQQRPAPQRSGPVRR